MGRPESVVDYGFRNVHERLICAPTGATRLNMSAGGPLAAEILAIQTSGALGRSELIRRLFDYLAQRTLDERAPKEAEVGASVFGRAPDFDPNRDAVVRVYVHKLRRKLDAIYAGPRKDAGARLNIPRGEYRLVLEPAELAEAVAPVGQAPAARPRPTLWLIAMVISMVGASAATWLVCQSRLPPAVRQGLDLRAGPIWGPLASDRLPTIVVVGDYYIFGESDDGMNVARLVREYTVNSASDLNAFLVQHPKLNGLYIDLDLRYLPVGSASALRSLAPVLASSPNAGPPRVILASALTPDMIRANNIIYIGYLSGLGPLRDTVFDGSRFSIGETYDQIVDVRTKRQFNSGGGGPDSDGAIYRDYGYVSSFSGPAGGRIVIIAGTRDVGLMQTAEAVANPSTLKTLNGRLRGAPNFEALYDVEGMDRQNVGGQLVVASPVDSAVKWNGAQKPQKAFPAG
jgi:hypothetical protein